jgi:hypothetical protein
MYRAWNEWTKITAGMRVDRTNTKRGDALGASIEQGELDRVFELVTGFRKAVALQLSGIVLAASIYTEDPVPFLRIAGAMLGCVGALFDAVQSVSQPGMFPVAVSLAP